MAPWRGANALPPLVEAVATAFVVSLNPIDWRIEMRHVIVGALAGGLALALSSAMPRATFAEAMAASDPSEHSFRTFFATRHVDDERFMEYIETARPEIVQVGQYGAMFHGYAHEEGATGWPMRLPTSGEAEVLEDQRRMNQRIQELGAKVIGHFRLVTVVGDWDEPAGFIDYYNNRWPEELLGERPHDDVRELLQREADGTPIQRSSPAGERYELCLSSPYARQMLKRMVDVAIDHGVDGLITTYNYHRACVCEYCQNAFRDWLGDRLGADALSDKLEIDSLDDHTFDEIPARITGYPDPDEATELDWLAMRWGAEHFKRMWDEIFIDHGRSRKPDLILSTWNHLSNIRRSEERAFLPIELWGKGEDYFWYSGGAAFVGDDHDLAAGKAGDAWLAMHYIRALGEGKPFVMGKYDRTRMAAEMAEGYATGGMGVGRYMRFHDDHGFDVLSRYSRFRHEHRDLFDNLTPFADLALVLPRQSIKLGHPESLEAFREFGQQLVERQALIDVVVDQRLTRERLEAYPAVVLPRVLALSDDQRAALAAYADDGGALLVFGETAALDETGEPRDAPGVEGAVVLDRDGGQDGVNAGAAADEAVNLLTSVANASAIDAPWTVRAATYLDGERMVLHLVNYDREADAPHDNRTSPETERPEAVTGVKVDLRLPEGAKATAATLYAPDREPAESLSLETGNGRAVFTVPRVLVYGVIEVTLE